MPTAAQVIPVNNKFTSSSDKLVINTITDAKFSPAVKIASKAANRGVLNFILYFYIYTTPLYYIIFGGICPHISAFCQKLVEFCGKLN